MPKREVEQDILPPSRQDAEEFSKSDTACSAMLTMRTNCVGAIPDFLQTERKSDKMLFGFGIGLISQKHRLDKSKMRFRLKQRIISAFMNSKSRNKKIPGWVWTLGVVIAMLTIALIVALQGQSEGKGFLGSVLAGACAGVVSVWFFLFCVLRIYMWITRGAPFKIGDRIIVTDGPFAGTVGEVQKICDGRCSVFVALESEPKPSDLKFFDWDEIRKIKKSKAT